MQVVLDTQQVKVSEDVANSLIMVRIDGAITPKTASAANESVLSRFSTNHHSVENPARMIADCTYVTGVDVKIRELRQVTSALSDERLTEVMLILPPGLIGNVVKFMGTLTAQMHRKRQFHIVQSVDEALKLLGI